MRTVVELRPAASVPVAEETPAKRITMDDGHTRIAHGLLEELMQAKYKLSGREYAVLLVVIRKTYGYMKSEDWIALSQFEEMTGIAKLDCRKVIKGLVERKMLVRSAQGNDQKLAVNTNVSDWLLDRPSKQLETAKRNARKSIRVNPPSKQNNPPSNEVNPPSKQDNPPTTIDKDNNNILKDSVPTPVETTPVQPPKKKTKSLKFTPEDRQFAEYMAERIDAVNGLSDNKPRNLDSWADQLRIMRERNGYEPEAIAAVFNWANQHNFWQSNIQSPSSLKHHFTRLYGECRKANHFGASNHENHNTTGQQHVEQYDPLNDLEWMD